MNKIIIPGLDNSITYRDIEKNQLRITVRFKKFFPNENCKIKINIEDNTFLCNLDLNNKDSKERSFRLVLRKEAMNLLNIEPGDSVQIIKTNDKEYNLKKIEIQTTRTKEQEEFIKKFMIK